MPYKELKSYNVKTVETPTTIEVWEYINEPVIYSASLDKDKDNNKKEIIDKAENNDNEIITAIKQYDAIKRKQKHYQEMRWIIARIIDCNFDDKTKFMTLTFKDNIQDISYTNYEFNKFIKRLNFHLYNDKKQKLKYIAVWEKQKRGAIHYHIIFFDFPYIKLKKLQEIWTHGFVKINKIDVDSKDNRGRYVSKYFSKDIDERDYKQKAFFKSRNLIMPITTKTTEEELIDFSQDNVVFTKIYSRKVPDYHNPFNDFDKGLKFTESKVRYTKIRKEHLNDKCNDN